MTWEDECIVLKKSADSGLIRLWSRDYGHWSGCSSKTTLQEGMQVDAIWIGKSESSSGRWKIESSSSAIISQIIECKKRLLAMISLCHISTILPERHGYPMLYDKLAQTLALLSGANWLNAMMDFEQDLLRECGLMEFDVADPRGRFSAIRKSIWEGFGINAVPKARAQLEKEVGPAGIEPATTPL